MSSVRLCLRRIAPLQIQVQEWVCNHAMCQTATVYPTRPCNIGFKRYTPVINFQPQHRSHQRIEPKGVNDRTCNATYFSNLAGTECSLRFINRLRRSMLGYHQYLYSITTRSRRVLQTPDISIHVKGQDRFERTIGTAGPKGQSASTCITVFQAPLRRRPTIIPIKIHRLERTP